MLTHGQPALAASDLAASELGKAAPLGLLVILVLCLAVFLLGRSMVTHLKRVPDSFDDPTGDADARQDRAADTDPDPR